MRCDFPGSVCHWLRRRSISFGERSATAWQGRRRSSGVLAARVGVPGQPNVVTAGAFLNARLSASPSAYCHFESIRDSTRDCDREDDNSRTNKERVIPAKRPDQEGHRFNNRHPDHRTNHRTASPDDHTRDYYDRYV
jgi:hypothetical protein